MMKWRTLYKPSSRKNHNLLPYFTITHFHISLNLLAREFLPVNAFMINTDFLFSACHTW